MFQQKPDDARVFGEVQRQVTVSIANIRIRAVLFEKN